MFFEHLADADDAALMRLRFALINIALSLFCLHPISYLLRLRFVHRKGRFVENNLPITVFVHNSGLSVEKHHDDPAIVHHIRIFVEDSYVVSFSWFA